MAARKKIKERAVVKEGINKRKMIVTKTMIIKDMVSQDV